MNNDLYGRKIRTVGDFGEMHYQWKKEMQYAGLDIPTDTPYRHFPIEMTEIEFLTLQRDLNIHLKNSPKDEAGMIRTIFGHPIYITNWPMRSIPVMRWKNAEALV